jgi:hypothetical protein
MAERSVNKAILVGRLGADAETRFTQNGTAVSRVSLAMNRQWTVRLRRNSVHQGWKRGRAIQRSSFRHILHPRLLQVSQGCGN